MPITFKNTKEVRLYKPNWSKNNTTNKYTTSGLAKNKTQKNTKIGHTTIDRNYNAEKNRLNALKKKEIRSMFTPIWMKLFKDISEKDERFHMNTEEADIVLDDLYNLLRSTAKGRAKRISDMNVSNEKKKELAEESIKEFTERATTLTYDIILTRIKQREEEKAAKAAAIAAAKAAALAKATKPQNLNRLSGKKRLERNK